MGELKFGEYSTKTLGLIIQAPPSYPIPAKDVTLEHIPGRNGDLTIDTNTWQNVEITYSLASVFNSGTDFIQNAGKFVKLLTTQRGYQKLEDTYDPLVYRMATFKNQGSLVNYYDEATALNITFNCKPQRYLKSGDVPINFGVGESTVVINNPYDYTSLPIISITNIPSAADVVLLAKITDNDNNVTSTITLSSIPAGDAIIDSDNQTVVSNQNGDINKYVSLNNMEFPVLKKGTNVVSIDKYSESNFILGKYDTVIKNNRNSCLALYKPYDAIVETKQKTAYMRAYNLVKQANEETYEGKAYANYLLEVANSYTFKSFNSVIKENSIDYSFQEDYSTAPDWLNIVVNSQDNSKVDIYLISSSFLPDGSTYDTDRAFVYTDQAKKIKRISVSASQTDANKIGTFKLSETVNISIYPSSSGNFAIDYTDYGIPSWLKTNVVVNDDGTVKSIQYITNKNNVWYYLPKGGLFSKAKWQQMQINKTLLELNWSTSKRAFLASGSSSTTSSYTYYENDDLPQYNDIYKDVLDQNGNVKKDANDNPIQELDVACHFRITSSDANLNKYNILAKDDGYYRLDGSEQTDWVWKNANASIASDRDSTKSFVVYYMSGIPDYSKEDLPDWVNPQPYNDNGTAISINPTHLNFKVAKKAFYRMSYEIGGNTYYTAWQLLNEGTLLPNLNQTIDGVAGTKYHGPDDNFYIYMIEQDGESTSFPVKSYTYTDPNGKVINDIGFFYINNTGEQVEYSGNTPPSWLKVTAVTDSDDVVTGIKFQVGNGVSAIDGGLFQWDMNTAWRKMMRNDTILESGLQDDTSIYYMSSIPNYPSQSKVNVIVNTNPETSNPESLTITAKSAGYFKPENSNSWVYYNIGDEIASIKITESMTIYYLTKISGTLGDITISITPRWWTL